MHAAVTARPGAAACGGAPLSIQLTVNATASSVVPKSSGSVIGVLCRYSTFGLIISSAAVTAAAVIDPVCRRITAARAPAPIAIEAIEIAIADAPLRYQASICTGSMFRTWGSGSQTAPICCHPGIRLSKMRRATTTWARAS